VVSRSRCDWPGRRSGADTLVAWAIGISAALRVPASTLFNDCVQRLTATRTYLINVLHPSKPLKKRGVGGRRTIYEMASS
jgi:hypothetical protein